MNASNSGDVHKTRNNNNNNISDVYVDNQNKCIDVNNVERTITKSNYVILNLNVSNRLVELLMDTGAEVNILKIEVLRDEVNLTNEIINITAVTQTRIKTLGIGIGKRKSEHCFSCSYRYV